ncbi:MAG: DNA translocase FtsK 4TM domain-containing protein, partial [Candidatus Omnitrophota bacterium]|nr:DNA translocase FtsK 4TM domain-containing protein [Candidatus Omnitrophota bacterium]
MQREKINEIWAVIFITAAVFIFLSLITFNPRDIFFYTSTPNIPVKNLAGPAGAYIGGFLFFLMGVSAYAIPVLLLIWGINRFLGAATQKLYTRIAGALILILAVSSLASMIAGAGTVEQFRSGGTFGFFISKILLRYCGITGSYLILFCLLALSLVLATEFMVFSLFLKLSHALAALFKKIKFRASYSLAEKSSKGRAVVREKPREPVLQPARPKAQGVEYTI